MLGPNTSNPGEQKFQSSKTSSQSRHMYNKEKKPPVFHIWATIKKVHFWLFGGGGGPRWPIKRAQLASQLTSHLYQSIYKIWKQSIQSYRVHKEMSADAAVA